MDLRINFKNVKQIKQSNSENPETIKEKIDRLSI